MYWTHILGLKALLFSSLGTSELWPLCLGTPWRAERLQCTSQSPEIRVKG